MKKFINLGAVLILIIGSSLLTRACFPNVVTKPSIPRIITQYDTVYTPPVYDTVKIATTDTVNLVIRETVHDTTVINVGQSDSTRENIFPVLHIRLGTTFGDTGQITTFSLRDGTGRVSEIFIPGYLTSLDVRPDSITPRMGFNPFPDYSVHFWDKLKYGFYGAVALITVVTSAALSFKLF